MKKVITLFAAVVMIASFSNTVFAQVTDHATASATIVTPIAITKTAEMNFGTVAVQSTTGGTVIMTPAGVRTLGGAGGVTLPTNATLNIAPTGASFTVTGTADYIYAITLPTALQPLTIKSGGNTMQVSAFTSTPSTTGILTGGTQTLIVGATLTLAAGQAAGTYISANSGFNVTVNYN